MRLPLLVLLAPALLAASPLLLTDIDPVLQELLEGDGSSLSVRTLGKVTHRLPSNDDLKPIGSLDSMELQYEDRLRNEESKDDEDSRLEDKRSGLRAAMVARGGRGVVLRPGWQVGGSPLTMGVHESMGPVTRRSQPSAAPYLSVGVLSNVEEYFKDLRNQLESLADPPNSIQNAHMHHGILREGPRPSATAAYLHALRSHRPSHRVRSFVEDPGPIELRGANSHDPALLWAGLGRR